MSIEFVGKALGLLLIVLMALTIIMLIIIIIGMICEAIRDLHKL